MSAVAPVSAVEPPLGPLFNTRDAAAYLGIDMEHLRGLIRTEKIQTLRDGRVRIYRRWCDEFVARLTTPVKSKRSDPPAPTASPVAPGIAHLMPAKRRFARAS